jgi:hypothetical protein
VPEERLAGIGAVVLFLLVIDALLGWRSLLTPLLGGSALQGERFFGLGNSYAGELLGGALLVAAVISMRAGLVLLVAAALFAGLPFLGADLGGGSALFIVAGLWFLLRRERRADLRALAIAAVGSLAGIALLILANRYVSPWPTHIGQSVENANGPLGVLDVLRDRLVENIHITTPTPWTWIALLALPAFLLVAWTRAGPFRPHLQAHPAWRDACVGLGVGGIVGYLLNDTWGMATTTFVYLIVALVYPAVLYRVGRSHER